MKETLRTKVVDLSVEDFKKLIGEIIDEKLTSNNLVRIDEQGYMYVFSKDSLLSLQSEFEAGLEESVKQSKRDKLIEQSKVWENLGVQ